MEHVEKNHTKSTTSHKVMTLLGAVLCVILIPILFINITLIVKSYTNQEEVPHFGGYSPLIVLTGSMETTISSGDLIVVKQVEDTDVQVGDIIAFFDPESTGSSVLTHRVTEIVSEGDTISFRTKGDANNAEDQTLVPSENLVGMYKMKIHGAGNIAMFMQTTTGLVICVILPLVLLVGFDLIRRRQFEKSNQQDTAALLAELEALKSKQEETETEKEDSHTAQ
jgi:signal peptidase